VKAISSLRSKLGNLTVAAKNFCLSVLNSVERASLQANAHSPNYKPRERRKYYIEDKIS